MMNKFGKELEDYLIFNNISLKEFADRIGTTSKNLIDIINGKISLSTNMIYNISFVTNIPVSYIENVESNYKLDQEIFKFINNKHLSIKNYLKLFSYKELPDKYHIKFTDERNDYDILKDILKYLRITDLETLYKPNNVIFYKSKNDKPELLALWLEKCYRSTLNQTVKEYKKENIVNVVKKIKVMAKDNIFDVKKLIGLFNNNGIFLAIEEDLSGAKIRGAFRVLNDKPAIYITKKHKRIADIYFALLHELAHCQSDFNRAKKGSIISTINDNNCEDYEINADNLAFNWMVDDIYYQKVKNEYNMIDKLDVIKSFYVYRLASDKIISYSSNLYQKYNLTI